MNADVARMKRRLQRAVNDLDRLIDTLDDAQALAELFRLLDHPRDPGISQQIGQVRDRLTRLLNGLVRQAPNGQQIFAGVGALKASWSGGSDRWDGVALVRAVAARAADVAHIDPLSGEIGDPLPPGALALFVANEIIAIAALDTKSASFRTGDVEARGFTVKDYREPSNDKRPTVRYA